MKLVTTIKRTLGQYGLAYPQNLTWTGYQFLPDDWYSEESQAIMNSYPNSWVYEYGISPYSSRAPVLKSIDVKTSDNTVRWIDSQGVNGPALVLTKNKPIRSSPKMPSYIRPRFGAVKPKPPEVALLRMIPPTMRNGEGLPEYNLRVERWSRVKISREAKINKYRNARYNKRLEKYNRNLERFNEILAKYDAAYQKRVDNYKQALLRYQESLERAKRPSFKAVKSSGAVLQDKPFIRVIAEFEGLPLISSSQLVVATSDVDIKVPRTNPPVDAFWLNGFYTDTKEYLRYDTKGSDIASAFNGLGERILAAASPALMDYDKKLRRKLHQKLKKSSVHVANLIAERKQTYDLILSTYKRLFKLVKLKKNLFKGAAGYLSNPKQIADDVLAFKFGAEPLINDIKQAIDYIDSSAENPLIVARVNTGPSFSLSIENEWLSFSGLVEVSYTVKCNLDNPAARTLSQLGLINPLEIAWEVLPWSFVVDWFLPVGEWISNQTSDCGLSFLTGSRKVKLVGNFEIRASSSYHHTLIKEHLGTSVGFEGKFKGSVTIREALTSLPDVPLPPVKNPWSWSHGVEAVALLVQRLSKGSSALR